MTDTIMIEARQRTLNLLPFVPRGGTRRGGGRQADGMLGFKIPAIKAARRIMADELLKVRAPGELRKYGYRELVNEALTDMLDELQYTKEVLLSYLLQGSFKDAVSGASYYDYFSEEGISQEAEIDFDLDNATPTARRVDREDQRDEADDARQRGRPRRVERHRPLLGRLLGPAPDRPQGSHRTRRGTTSAPSQTEFVTNRDVSDGSFTVARRHLDRVQPHRQRASSRAPADKVLLFPARRGEPLPVSATRRRTSSSTTCRTR
jgi:hypothetical protein